MATSPEKATEQSRLVDIRSAARHLSLSYWSVREMVLSGQIPHVRFGRKYLIERRDLDWWVDRNKQVGT